MPRASGHGDMLSRWLEVEGIVPVAGPGAIADIVAVRALLIQAARERRALSYSELLGKLGHRFTRPKMRAACRTLDAIDREGSSRGEPELAVLVVRESDRLPGAGWWSGREAAPAWPRPMSPNCSSNASIGRGPTRAARYSPTGRRS